jgi:membrane-bound lytic murein transglycosylase A
MPLKGVAGALGAALILSACAVVPQGVPSRPGTPPPPPRAAPAPLAPRPTVPVTPSTTSAPAGANARGSGVVAGPDVATLVTDDVAAQRALAAFRLSCPGLQRRTDASGLTRGADWSAACAASSGWTGRATDFFAAQFEAVQIGDGRGFATGYYEPEIKGCRTQRPGCAVPVYPRPADLIDVDLGRFSDTLKGRSIRGRVDGVSFVPYWDRGAIDDGALNGRATPIAYADDYIEFFFLQVQGSGRLRLPDGSVMRIGYASQNGRDYTGIGRVMRDRGLVQPGQASMQGLMAWLRANPADGMAIMRENKSYVFFRELTGAGPLGAMGVAVVAKASVAADPAYVPLGAPIWLDLDRNEADGLWVAQDTGGAIKGANRFDTFWGAGDEARTIAGGMSGRGIAYVLVPRGTLARLQADGAPAQP